MLWALSLTGHRANESVVREFEMRSVSCIFLAGAEMEGHGVEENDGIPPHVGSN